MVELLFLLLPFAFYSGWKASRNRFKQNQKKQRQLSGHFVKGVNYLLNEEPDKALEIFLNYPDIDQYTAETYQLLGNLFRNRGEVDRALRVHQNLIARANLNNQQKHKAMFSLGQDFFAAGMLDRAESVFQELLDNTKTSKYISKASLCTALRTIYEQTQEWKKAIEATDCYKKSNKNEQDHTSIDSNALIAHYYCELADEALHQGKIHEVDAFMAKAKKASKKSTRLMCLQGDVAFHQEKYQEALNKYLAAIKLDSRLLSLLSVKLERCANKVQSMAFLQSELLKLYKDKRKGILESILVFANKYESQTALIDELITSELASERLNIESIYNASEYIREKRGAIDSEKGLELINISLAKYLQGVPAFRCEHCGYKMHDFLWRCPACNHWDTINHA